MGIRNAVMEDLAAVTGVEAACFPAAEAATEQDFAKRLAVYPDHFWLLETEEGRLVSFVNGLVTNEPDLRDEMYSDASFHNKGGDWQMIFGVNTLPGYRRRGLAGQVIRQMIADARVQSRKGCVLTCKEGLIPYYEKFGFVNEGVSGSVHGGVVWYQMRLTFNEEA